MTRRPLWMLVGSLALGGLTAGCLTRTPDNKQRPGRPTADLYERFRLERTPEPNTGPAILGGPSQPGEADGAETVPLSATASVAPEDQGQPVQVEDVIRSVEGHFPLILAALEEVQIAAGRVQSAEGGFDTKLASKNLFELDGFYESERVDIGFEQPTTLWGTRFTGGYRLGQGDFAVYDGKAKTNETGEVRLGLIVPLLQGGRIDPARVDLWQARIDQESAEPKILEKRLGATRKAAQAYWKWVARGAKLRIADQILQLALDRREQLQATVEEGLLAPINLTDNRRLIVERSAKRTQAERGFQQASIALSLFLRDAEGGPIVPTLEALPDAFPGTRDPVGILVEGDVEIALARRPEVRQIELDRESLELTLELARNQRLAALDVGLIASQDLGPSVNTPDDKSPFEIAAQVRFELPLQRRKARGKERETIGKLAKLDHQLRFTQEVVATEVQDAVSALRQSWLRVNQASENRDLAAELEQAEREQLDLGESDLFRVNVREQQSAVAASSLVDTQAEYFLALADYRAVLGLPYDEVVAGGEVGTVR